MRGDSVVTRARSPAGLGCNDSITPPSPPRRTSGTVLMPTASPPMDRRNRDSARDSYAGPETKQYVPSCRKMRLRLST